MKKAKAAQYELMAMKVGDGLLGNTEVLAEVSLDELKTIERIAKALAREKTGVLLAAVKTHVDFLGILGKATCGRRRFAGLATPSIDGHKEDFKAEWTEGGEARGAAMRHEETSKRAEEIGVRAYERKV